MTEQHPIDLLAAYALGSLDGEELIRVSRHLPTCPVCRAEVNAYFEVADQLALSVNPRIPPPDLKDRIMQRAVGASIQAAPKKAAVQQPESGWRALFGSLLSAHSVALAVGVMAILLIAIGALIWRQVGPAGQNHMRIVRLEGTPDAPQVVGYLMVFEEEPYGTLVVEDAPPLPQGYQYQLWLIRDGMRTNGGVFSVDKDGYGVLQVSADLPLNEYPSFGVTVEPEGGSPGPTGKKVMGGDQ